MQKSSNRDFQEQEKTFDLLNAYFACAKYSALSLKLKTSHSNCAKTLTPAARGQRVSGFIIKTMKREEKDTVSPCKWFLWSRYPLKPVREAKKIKLLFRDPSRQRRRKAFEENICKLKSVNFSKPKLTNYLSLSLQYNTLRGLVSHKNMKAQFQKWKINMILEK